MYSFLLFFRNEFKTIFVILFCAAKKGTKTIEVPSSPPSPKFERILMMPTNNVNNTTIATPSSPPPLPPPTTLPPPSIDTPTIASTPVDLNSVWNIHNENDHNIPILNERCNANETSIEQACQFFEICIANFTMLIEEVEAKLLLKSGSGSDISSNSMGNMQYGGYNTMPFQHSWYEFVSIQVAFYGGLLLGTLLGAIILFILKLISDCVMWSSTEDSSRRIRRKRSKILIFHHSRAPLFPHMGGCGCLYVCILLQSISFSICN